MTKSEKWFRIIQRQESSKLTIAEFCRKNGYGYSTFTSWKKKLKGSTSQKQLPAFVELKQESFFEFHVNEVKLRVDDSLAPQQLSLIIAAAAQAGSRV